MAWLQPFSANTMALEEALEDARKLLLRVVVGA
jgi:hypothetical protein